MEELRATYNKIANGWAQKYQDDPRRMPLLQKFASYLSLGASVLDLGCGPGFHAEHLHGAGFGVMGVDISDEMIRLARKRVPEATFVRMDMRDIGSIPGEFDAIHAYASLLHLPKKDVPDLLRTCLLKLRHGGVMDAFVKGARGDRDDEMMVPECNFGLSFERFFSYYRESEMVDLLADAGFEVLSSHVEGAMDAPWVYVIARGPT